MIPHVLVVVPYLRILVRHAIKCCVKFFRLNSLNGDDGVPSLQATCPLQASWAWISSPDPFRTFLLGFLKPQLYSHISFALKREVQLAFKLLLTIVQDLNDVVT